MTTLAFPDQVPFTDPSVPAGGCELGMGRCMNEAEVEVVIKATNDVRRLCRGHVGFYMFAATSATHYTGLRVRQLASGERGRNGT